MKKQLKPYTALCTGALAVMFLFVGMAGCKTTPGTTTITQSTNAAGTVIQVTNTTPAVTTVDTNQLLGGIALATQVAVDEAYVADPNITPYLSLTTNVLNLVIASGNINPTNLIAQLNAVTVNGVTNRQYTIAITGILKAYTTFVGQVVNQNMNDAAPLLVQALQVIVQTMQAEIQANQPAPATVTPYAGAGAPAPCDYSRATYPDYPCLVVL
jgi:hypothetical protein